MASEAEGGKPLNDVIYNALVRLQYAGYDFADLTLFKVDLEDYIGTHPEDEACITQMAEAYTKFLPWTVG